MEHKANTIKPWICKIKQAGAADNNENVSHSMGFGKLSTNTSTRILSVDRPQGSQIYLVDIFLCMRMGN